MLDEIDCRGKHVLMGENKWEMTITVRVAWFVVKGLVEALPTKQSWFYLFLLLFWHFLIFYYYGVSTLLNSLDFEGTEVGKELENLKAERL